MIQNYFKIAWRSLKLQPFFTFLNTFGLAIGIAGGLLIALFIHDELSFDKMFADADRIYRVNADVKFGGEENAFAVVSAPMAATMQHDFPQVELTTRFRDRIGMLIRGSEADENVKEEGVTFVDPSFFEMFGLDLLYGDAKAALNEPQTLILTETAAKKHFGLKEAVGQQVLLNNSDTYTVTGIIKDMPKNSFLRNYDIFMAMEGWEDAKSTAWGSHNYPTFIKLIPSASIDDLQAPLQSLFGTYVIPSVQPYFPGITEENFLAAGNYLNYSTISLKDIHLYSHRDAELSANGDIQNVYILSCIGLFLILLASVNFMNLSTAHSLKRAKEVGIRKTLGSSKFELVLQFLAESGLITFISLLLAIVIATIAMPFFNDLADKEIAIPFTNPLFWLLIFCASLLLGLFSGLYPAFFMSKFVPVKVLKGGGESNTGGAKVRSFLVVFQFAISVFLIISTLVVFQQLNFIYNKDLGYAKDRVLVVNDVHAAGNQIQSFKQEVEQLGQVKSATLSGYLPTPSYRSDNSFFREGFSEQEYALQMQQWGVDYDYVHTLGLEIIAGRDFDEKFGRDSLAMIINESAIEILGIEPEEALGLRLSQGFLNEDANFYTVIGVVKNFHFESLRENISALSISLSESRGALAVKIEGANVSNTISHVENIWNKLAPGQPFDYYFLEESFDNTYNSEQRLGRIFLIFTCLSIFIACLGLFGLAAFNAEKRAKEIGIRKVLGASVGQITYKLSVDFLKLVGMAIIISIPLAWFGMNSWLEDFSYRIEIGWGVFTLAIFLAVGISILTVSYQSIKAALANPIESLKAE